MSRNSLVYTKVGTKYKACTMMQTRKETTHENDFPELGNYFVKSVETLYK